MSPPSEEALLARYPHASALGKLLLAAQPNDDLIAVVREHTERPAPLLARARHGGSSPRPQKAGDP